MAKTKEELKELKQEYESLNNKLKDLTDDELKVVTGGNSWGVYYGDEGKDGAEPGYMEPFN